jgi:hypothetical protein
LTLHFLAHFSINFVLFLTLFLHLQTKTKTRQLPATKSRPFSNAIGLRSLFWSRPESCLKSFAANTRSSRLETHSSADTSQVHISPHSTEFGQIRLLSVSRAIHPSTSPLWPTITTNQSVRSAHISLFCVLFRNVARSPSVRLGSTTVKGELALANQEADQVKMSGFV